MVTGSPDEAEARAQRAFEHAVDHELDAIETHERAATRHEEIAARHEQAALTADGDVGDEFTRLAQWERERAALARARAEAARERLRRDGVDPER